MMRSDIKRHVVTYGFDEAADVTALDVQMKGFGSVCTVRARRPGGRVGRARAAAARRPGPAQRAQRARRRGDVAASSASRGATSRGRSADSRAQSAAFSGAAKPTASPSSKTTDIIRPRLPRSSPRRKPIAEGRLIVAFQPHRFTRTQFLLSEFGPAFAGADVVVLTDIYAAGEDPIAGVTLDALADTVRSGFSGELRIVRALADVPRELAALAKPGDLIVLLGAGSIGSIAGSVLSALGSKG